MFLAVGPSLLQDISAIVSVVVFLIAAAGAAVAYFLRRRNSSGRISTSAAEVLWQQAQDMRTQLIAEKNTAEAQRDRLMSIQAEQVVPLLTAMNDSLKQTLSMVTKVIDWQEGRTKALSDMEQDLLNRLKVSHE